MAQSVGWVEWMIVSAVVLALLLACALIWTAMGRKTDWTGVGVISAIIIIIGLAYGLVIWVVPEDLIRCQYIPGEGPQPDASPIPDDCTSLDWIRDTAIFIVAIGFALVFMLYVFFGVKWCVDRLRAPPDGS